MSSLSKVAIFKKQDPDLLADVLLKRASTLVSLYKQESARESKSSSRHESSGKLATIRTERFVYPFDNVDFVTKGIHHQSQFVVILSIWTWMKGSNPLELTGKKLTVNDVEIQLRY